MELIDQLTSSLGIDQGKAQGAAGAVLGFFKQQAPTEFAAVEQKVPEAGGLIQAAPPQEPASGLGGMLGGALGGLGGQAAGAGGLAALTGTLAKLGIGGDKLGTLLPIVLRFLQSRAGDGVVGQLIARVPGLSQFAGGGTGGLGGALGGLFK